MKISTIERFFRKVSKTQGCWSWVGNKDSLGYGRFKLNGKSLYAHRYSLSIIEPLVKGKEVDHLCRNRSCVNPKHLEQVDHLTNLRRSPLHFINKPRKYLTKPICKYGHKKTYYKNQGKLVCKICTLANVKRFNAKQSEL